MPWHYKAMKDAITCEKLRGAGHKLWSEDIWMGQPSMSYIMLSIDEYIVYEKLNLGNWNILVPRGKEREIDSVSSGERKRRSPNQPRVGVRTTELMQLFEKNGLGKPTKEGDSPVFIGVIDTVESRVRRGTWNLVGMCADHRIRLNTN